MDHTIEAFMAAGVENRNDIPTADQVSGIGGCLTDAKEWIAGLPTPHARIFRVTITVHEEVYHDDDVDPDA
jgi:hypothetical protein